MMVKNNIHISLLDSKDALRLNEVVNKSTEEYNKYFTPFEFSIDSFTKILSKAIKDRYYGVFVDSNLAGFYMLRGLDQGFTIPSYGVWISQDYKGLGLATLTLYHAFSICRLLNVKEIMLKVHPDNIIAKNIYEKCGFTQKGFDVKNGNYVYNKTL